MTDCHPTLPESLIMQAEALPAKHSKYRKEGPLASEFVSLEGAGEKEGKETVTGFSPTTSKAWIIVFFHKINNRKAHEASLGCFFYYLHYNTDFIPSPLYFFWREGGKYVVL